MTSPRHQHTCTVCGASGPWTARWRWFGSYSEIEAGKVVPRFCNAACYAQVAHTIVPRMPTAAYDEWKAICAMPELSAAIYMAVGETPGIGVGDAAAEAGTHFSTAAFKGALAPLLAAGLVRRRSRSRGGQALYLKEVSVD